MKRWLHLWVFFSLVVVGCNSALAASLWRVDGSHGTVYLLGSLHALHQEAYPLPAVMEQAFNDSDRIVFEVDLDALTQKEQIQLFAQYGLNKKAGSLAEDLGASLFEKAKQRVSDMGYSMTPFIRFKPWAFSMRLVMLKLHQQGISSNLGVERHFFRRAMDAGKPIDGLETMASQFKTLNRLSLAVQRRMVGQTLTDLPRTEDAYARIFAAWQTGDLARIESEMLDDLREDPEVYRRLIQQRNEAWIPQLVQLLEQPGTNLVIVGLAHLPGPDGLIAGLSHAGYSLQQQAEAIK